MGDVGITECPRGMDARLPAGKALGRNPPTAQLHSQQRRADLFSGAEQLVFFPEAGTGRECFGFFQQNIGGIPLSGNHHRRLPAVAHRLRCQLSGAAQPQGILHGCAAEFLNHPHIHSSRHHCMSKGDERCKKMPPTHVGGAAVPPDNGATQRVRIRWLPTPPGNVIHAKPSRRNWGGSAIMVVKVE